MGQFRSAGCPEGRGNIRSDPLGFYKNAGDFRLGIGKVHSRRKLNKDHVDRLTSGTTTHSKPLPGRGDWNENKVIRIAQRSATCHGRYPNDCGRDAVQAYAASDGALSAKELFGDR